MRIAFTFLLINLLTSLRLFGHHAIEQPGDTICYYVSLNPVYEHKVLEVHQSLLCFEYQDRYGKTDSVRMNFYDWRHQLMAGVSLPKHFGRNTYSLDLSDFGLAYNNQHITVEVLAEDGKKTETILKLISKPKTEPPSVEIFVNPVQMLCAESGRNLVEFYSTIKGGKAPYTVEWKVTTGSETALLYQPKKVTVQHRGTTPSIQVDRVPSYYVQVQVIDDCGNVGKQVVLVQCISTREKPNAVLLQPVPSLPPAVPLPLTGKQ
jgi:hypothetical protein